MGSFSVLHFLRSFDLLDDPIQINVGGQGNYKTLFGSVLSVLYLIIAISFVAYQMIGYFDLSSPQSFYESSSTPNYPLFNIRDSKMIPLPVFRIGTTFLNASLVPDMFLVMYDQYYKTVTYSSTSNASQVNSTHTFYNVIPCGSLSDEEKTYFDFLDKNSYVYSMIMTYALCPMTLTSNFSASMFVEGSITSDVQREVNIYVYPCNNTSNPQCNNTINPKVSFGFINPNLLTLVGNLDQPLQLTMTMKDLYFPNQNTLQSIQVSLGQRVVSDYGYKYLAWTNTSKSLHMSSVTSNSQFVSFNQNQPYMRYILRSSQDLVVVRRVYLSVSDIVGKIGGVNGVLFVFFALIYRYFYNSKRDLHIIKSLYPSIFQDLESSGQSSPKASEVRPAHNQNLILSLPQATTGGGLDNHQIQFNKSENGIRQSGISTSEANLQVLSQIPITDQVPAKNKKLLPSRYCRRKNEQQRKLEENCKIAVTKIREALEVKNIIRNSVMIKILSEIMFEERHIGLAEKLDFATNSKEDEEQISEKTPLEVQDHHGSQSRAKSSTSKLKYYNPCMRLDTLRAKNKKKEWLRELVPSTEAQENAADQKPAAASIHKGLVSMIDEYYREHLNLNLEAEQRISPFRSKLQVFPTPSNPPSTNTLQNLLTPFPHLHPIEDHQKMKIQKSGARTGNTLIKIIK